ncbi:MAG: hypothetical protein BWK79_08495 [Beggiatoa sp. IS2]|nr:MAG: hypothetical protein BWK79_08495 [Beggiatoa sp. IS2]
MMFSLLSLPVLAEPIAKLVPSSLNFKGQAINVVSAEHALTLNNTGQEDLTTLSITLSGTHKSDFTSVSDCGTTLVVGQGCNLKVTFKPKAEGAREATLTVKSNAGPIEATLKGTGIITKPDPSVTPIDEDFGSRSIGIGSVTKTVTLKNNGNGELNKIKFSIETTKKGEFTVSAPDCTVLAPGKNCKVSLTFEPAVEGERTAILTITSNAETTLQVTLKGVGIVEKPQIKLSPTSLRFSTQLTATTSAEKTITVSNTGKGDLKNLGIKLEGTHKTEFKIASNTCAVSLAPGEGCKVTLTFTPKAEGAREAILTVKSNATETPSQIALTGTGTPNPYPSLGKAFVLGTDGQILPVQSKFYGGIAVKGGKLLKTNKIKWISDATTGQFASEPITLTGLIAPDAENVGQAAEVFVVEFLVPADAEGKATGSYEDCGNPEKGAFYMWTTQEALSLELWNGYPETLIPFSRIEALTNSSTLKVYQGSLPSAGHHCLYFGYRIPDGRLFFNGEATINFAVSQ